MAGSPQPWPALFPAPTIGRRTRDATSSRYPTRQERQFVITAHERPPSGARLLIGPIFGRPPARVITDAYR